MITSHVRPPISKSPLPKGERARERGVSNGKKANVPMWWYGTVTKDLQDC